MCFSRRVQLSHTPLHVKVDFTVYLFLLFWVRLSLSVQLFFITPSTDWCLVVVYNRAAFFKTLRTCWILKMCGFIIHTCTHIIKPQILFHLGNSLDPRKLCRQAGRERYALSRFACRPPPPTTTTPDSSLKARLQRVQNNAAHMVLRIPRTAHITPHLVTLHNGFQSHHG